jgi:hypothetical protein
VVCNKGVERYLDELRSYRTEELGLSPSDQEYVFCNPSGTPVGSFKGGFQRVLKEEGVLARQGRVLLGTNKKGAHGIRSPRWGPSLGSMHRSIAYAGLRTLALRAQSRI